MLKPHRELGTISHSLSGFLDAPGKSLQVENPTLSFMKEKSSSISQLPSSSPCILAHIPLWDLFNIIDRLANPWVISLAMTSKDFYAVVELYYKKKLVLTERDVAIFTMTLQRDIPNVFCCVGCHKLVPLNPSGSWKDQGHHRNCPGSSWWDWWDWCSAQKRLSKWDIRTLLWHPSAKEAMLPFMDAYLVMNRHFYGDLHGVQLQVLERHAAFEKYLVLNDGLYLGPFDWNKYWPLDRTCEARKALKAFNKGVFDQRPEGSAAGSFERPWRFSYDYVPRIINDELYMARFHKIDGPMVPWQHFAALLNSIQLPICHHLEFKVEAYGSILIEHIDRQIALSNVLYDDMNNVERGSCIDCFADYDFSVTRDVAKKEWSFRFTTYHCLGACRSPFHSDWDQLNNGALNWSHDSDEHRMKYGHLQGKTRREWHESNDRE